MSYKLLSQDDVKRFVSYDPDTGVFTRLKSLNNQNVGQTTWRPDGCGYARIRIQRHNIQSHRIAWMYIYGEWPQEEIDHVNGNTLDNRIANLRHVSHKENGKNTKLYCTNKSGISGVFYRHNLWFAQIGSKKPRHIGSSNDFFEACCMRKSAESRLGFHPNHGRTEIRQLGGE